MSNKREALLLTCPDDAEILFLDPPEMYDDAIIGLSERFGGYYAVAYDIEKIIQANVADGMSYDEAIEYFEFNQIGAYAGDSTPIYVNVLEEV